MAFILVLATVQTWTGSYTLLLGNNVWTQPSILSGLLVWSFGVHTIISLLAHTSTFIHTSQETARYPPWLLAIPPILSIFIPPVVILPSLLVCLSYTCAVSRRYKVRPRASTAKADCPGTSLGLAHPAVAIARTGRLAASYARRSAYRLSLPI